MKPVFPLPACGEARGLLLTVALLLLVAGCAFGAEAEPREKHVEIDKTEQVLRAYEDGELVFETRVSTGKPSSETPSGQFRAGVKYRMHYSSRYNHAPMPYSVQVAGHYFIHGYKDVPPWPASHGCIRVPLVGSNPAAWFYSWVETGTPIVITGRWHGTKQVAAKTTPGAAVQRRRGPPGEVALSRN
jgi:hypothetical protein